MQRPQEKHTTGQVVSGLVLALAAGFLCPTMIPFVMVGSVALTLLYVHGGFLPFIVCAIVQLLMFDALGDLVLMGIGLVAVVLPATLAVRGLRWRRPFFDQLKLGILYQMAGVLGAVLLAYYTFGGDLIGQFTRSYGELLNNYPAEMVDELLSMLYGSGEEALETADRARYVAALVEDLERMLSVYLPGWLLGGGLAGGILMVTWANCLQTRRGQGSEGSYVSLDNWSLPHATVLGMLALYGVALGMALGGYNNGLAISSTVGALFETCFLVQASASLSRQLKKVGAGPGRRNAAIVAAVILLRKLFVAYGVVSALFGSRGVVTVFMRSRQDKG